MFLLFSLFSLFSLFVLFVLSSLKCLGMDNVEVRVPSVGGWTPSS